MNAPTRAIPLLEIRETYRHGMQNDVYPVASGVQAPCPYDMQTACHTAEA